MPFAIVSIYISTSGKSDYLNQVTRIMFSMIFKLTVCGVAFIRARLVFPDFLIGPNA